MDTSARRVSRISKYGLLLISLLFALYLGFWFFEGLGSPRIDAIATFEQKHFHRAPLLVPWYGKSLYRWNGGVSWVVRPGVLLPVILKYPGG